MLSINEVEKLAKLAKLELTPEEKEKFASEISSILNYVAMLQEIKAEAIDLTEETEGYLRTDRVMGLPLVEQEQLIANAPERQDNLIKTKKIFE